MLPSTTLSTSSAAGAVLLIHIADRACGLPLACVERVLPMAYVLPLPESGRDLAGVLNLHGDILPVVDPRPRLGLPTPPPTPEQHLVLVAGEAHFLLWVDSIDEVVPGAAALRPDPMPQVSPLVAQVIRLGDQIVPILAPTAFEPRS
jgi:purine-binding chemotaxis protein CheW